MLKKNEAHFKDKVKDRLKSLGPECYFFIKEAKSLRGIADVIGCYRGRFFAWELKKSQAEAHKDRDGHKLQLFYLEKVKTSGGLGRVVYPENFEECWAELIA